VAKFHGNVHSLSENAESFRELLILTQPVHAGQVQSKTGD